MPIGFRRGEPIYGYAQSFYFFGPGLMAIVSMIGSIMAFADGEYLWPVAFAGLSVAFALMAAYHTTLRKVWQERFPAYYDHLDPIEWFGYGLGVFTLKLLGRYVPAPEIRSAEVISSNMAIPSDARPPKPHHYTENQLGSLFKEGMYWIGLSMLGIIYSSLKSGAEAKTWAMIAILLIVMNVGGMAWGVHLDRLYSERRPHWTKSNLSLIETIGYQIGLAVYRPWMWLLKLFRPS